jgi:hypothetical protein
MFGFDVVLGQALAIGLLKAKIDSLEAGRSSTLAENSRLVACLGAEREKVIALEQARAADQQRIFHLEAELARPRAGSGNG